MAKEDGGTTIINVAEGRYSPSTTGESFPLIIPDNIHLIGANWENTIIDIEATQDKQARGFIVQEVINVKIANFTITGGSAEDAGCQGGGAILLTNNDDAVYNDDGSWAPYAPSTPVLENLYLTGNHAYNGGGIGVFRLIGPTMENIIVEGNSDSSFGGGVFHHAGVTTISNAKITNNYALTQHGGGIAVFVGGTGLNNVEISHNTAEYLGGGLAIYESEVDLLNTTFSNNIDHANNSAIWSSNSTASLVNSIVWDNQPNQLEGAYTINFCIVRYITIIYGIFSVTLDWMSVKEDQLPKTYAIHQNYPNPFNPITTLRYGLPEDAMVNITIYDMMGRIVSTLVNENQSSGYKTLQWNATNDSGQPVSAGVYIYAIKAGNFAQTKKMILLK